MFSLFWEAFLLSRRAPAKRGEKSGRRPLHKIQMLILHRKTCPYNMIFALFNQKEKRKKAGQREAFMLLFKKVMKSGLFGFFNA